MAKSRFVSQQHPVKSWKRCQDFKGGVCPLLWPGDPKSRELRLLQNPNRRPRARSCKERFWSPSRSQQFPQANRMIPWFAARSKARKRSGALWRKSWTLMSKCTLKLQPSIGRTREAAVVSLRILIWSPGRWFWTLLQRHLSRCTFVFAKRQTEFCSEQMLAPIKYSPNMSRCIIVTFFHCRIIFLRGAWGSAASFFFVVTWHFWVPQVQACNSHVLWKKGVQASDFSTRVPEGWKAKAMAAIGERYRRCLQNCWHKVQKLGHNARIFATQQATRGQHIAISFYCDFSSVCLRTRHIRAPFHLVCLNRCLLFSIWLIRA